MSKRITSMKRRQFLRLTASGLAAGALGFPSIVGCGRSRRQRLLVLGIDGFAPDLLRQYLDAGHMPHTQALLERAHMRPLATSNPPLSPVAWSNMIAGTNPGGHGIYDFVVRDPATLTPRLSLAHTEESPRVVTSGKWALPLASPSLHNARCGDTFWDLLEKQGVPCTILRMPANFPPTTTTATSLSGLGTPDIHGSYGIFTQYTDAPGAVTRNVSGGRIERVRIENGDARCFLRGPVNTLRRDRAPVDIPFQVAVDATRGVARLRVQETDIVLNEGEWSDWVRVRFTLMPFFAHVSGICRFHLQSTRREFSLYVTPINIDPRDPALPISTPEDYARHLADEIGPYYTQGMPEDTSARRAGVFNDDEYRDQAEYVIEEEMRMYRRELDRFDSGCYFYYFSSIDLNCHLFWRTLDPQHPLYTPELARRHGNFIPKLYQRMDDAIGLAMRRLGNDGTLVIMSDHGFGSFRRQFNLNSWLLKEGYAGTLDSPGNHHTDLLANVDWKHTRAYGLGLNGLYLNLAGREAQGTVSPTAREALLDELQHRLADVRDPDSGEPVVSRVFRATDIYSGPYTASAPDLVIGYNRYYRASWDTVLGGFAPEQVEDNRDPWSGDHANDPQFVPGVLIATRPLTTDTPALSDLAPSFLQLFNVPVPATMTGARIFS
ncbi:MAG: alkaline phosphatase family protein [Lentisphaerae bacterium]|nr:alkaline phosphatase family protein [Lentisphaerota bacterium]